MTVRRGLSFPFFTKYDFVFIEMIEKDKSICPDDR